MTETLCYGTGLGYIAFLRHSPVDVRMSWFTIEFMSNIDQMLFQETCTRRLGSGFEITCMSWDMYSEGSTWIAIGTRDKIVQVLALNTNLQLEAIFAVRLDNTVLKSVAFADDKGVYVFGVYDGNFIKLKGDDSAVLKEYSCQSVM